MKKVLYTDFVEIETVIDSMMDNPGLKKAVAKTNLYTFWNSILPEKLKQTSKPYSMLPNGVMVVACKNSVIAQELTLHKIMLLAKFSAYAKSMHLKLTDIRFDAKKWQG